MSSSASLQRLRENVVALLLIAILIGVLTGALAVGFRYLLLYAIDLIWGDAFDPIGAARSLPWYWVVLFPVLGGVVIGPIIAHFAPETRGAGVPEVIEAVVAREGAIRHRTTFFKLISTVISIGSGASVGREGPVVHIGSSVGSSISQLIGLSVEWRRVFLACGAAAGIAATFNAPMTGMLFAAEIILVDFQINYLSHIAIASVTATVVSHHFLGSLPALKVPLYELLSYREIPLYFLLGILAGGMAILFIRSLSKVENMFDRSRIPLALRPAIGGLVVGILALSYPQVLGVGYETIDQVLNVPLAVSLMAIVLLAKLVATAMSIGAGFSGGIFAPSLVLGGLLGGVFGSLVHTLFPAWSAPPSAYALVAMGAMVSGTTLAPITAIFTIFELTYDFEIILPLMTSCIASLVVVQKFYGYSIYETKLLKKGIRIVRGHDVNLLRGMKVGNFMDTKFESVRDCDLLKDLVTRAETSPYPHFVVLDRELELAGMLSLRDLKAVLTDVGELSDLIVASEIMTRDVLSLTPEDNFETAFAVFEGRHISTLPVVDPAHPKRVLGILKKSTLLLAYNQKVLKSHLFPLDSNQSGPERHIGT